MNPFRRSVPVQVLTTCAAIALATLLRLLLGDWLATQAVLSTLLIAAFLVALFGGLWQGLLAVGLSLLSAWFVLLPRFVPGATPADLQPRVMAFLAVTLLLCVIGSLVHRAQRGSERYARELFTQRQLLQMTLQSIGDGVITTDATGRITSMNAVAAAVTGWDAPDAIGRPFEKVYRFADDDNGAGIRQRFRRVVDTGEAEALAVHATLISKDGQERVLEDSIAPILGRRGAVEGVVAVFRDVTARRRAEDAQQLLAAVVASSDDAVVSKTLMGIITSWNAGAERIFGYTAAEAVGQPITMIIPHERLDEERTILERLAQGVRIDHFETVRRHKSGRLIDVSLTVSPVYDKSGRLIGASKIARDVTESKANEQRLRLLAAVVEHASDFIGVASPDLVPKFVNEAGRRMVGLEPDADLSQLHVMDFFVPEERERIERDAVPALLRDGRWRGETRFRNFVTGDAIDTLWNVTVIRDVNGAPIAYASVSPNLTEAKAVARALAESQAQLAAETITLRQLHDLSSRLLMTDSLEPSLSEVLAGAMELLHADLGTIQLIDLETHGLEVVAQVGFSGSLMERYRAISAGVGTASTRALESRKRVIIEDINRDAGYAAYRSFAETAGYQAVQATPLIGQSGRPVGVLTTHFRRPYRPTPTQLQFLDMYVGLAAEFLERVRGNESLRASEERFHTLADNIAQFVWMADRGGHVFWFNKRWLADTGTILNEMQGSGWQALLHPGQAERVLQSYRRSIETGVVWEDTFQLRVRDGAYRWFLARAVPIVDDDGRIVRWLGTKTDVTAQRDAQDALQEADRRKDEFLATLAHELRNPIAPIRYSLELLKQDEGGKDERGKDERGKDERIHAVMDRQLGHLERLVEDLLDISRINRDRLTLRRQRVNLASALTQAVELCRPAIDAAKQDLIVTLPSEPILLDGDPVRLIQVFGNLLDNACKYTPTGGELRVEARLDRGDAVVSVRDSGIGLAPAMAARVFEIGVADWSAGRAQGGLGIGLQLVKRLVDLHAGTVEIKSEGLGRGVEAIVRLPRLAIPSADTDEPKTVTGTTPTAMPRVLVVDDNRDAADCLAALLRAEGYPTDLVYDGFAALDAAQAVAPDAVLLDLGLPGISGYEVARQIREQPWGRSIVLIALTGWGQDRDRIMSKTVGFDEHLVKPVDLSSLLTMLSSLSVARREHAATET